MPLSSCCPWAVIWHGSGWSRSRFCRCTTGMAPVRSKSVNTPTRDAPPGPEGMLKCNRGTNGVDKRVVHTAWETSSEGLWRTLGRLRIGLGAGLALLALVSLPHRDPPLLLLLGSFTVGFVAANAAGLRCRPERRRLAELASMVSGVGAISCLVAATGGADGPLLFLFLVPLFTYGFRSGPRAAHPSAAVNSAALAGMSAATLRNDSSTPRLLGPAVLVGLMRFEARAVAVVGAPLSRAAGRAHAGCPA